MERIVNLVTGNATSRYSATAFPTPETLRAICWGASSLPRFERLTFGEVFPPPRNPVAFLLTARLEIVAEGDRRKSAIHRTLRHTRRLAALSVCSTASAAPRPTTNGHVRWLPPNLPRPTVIHDAFGRRDTLAFLRQDAARDRSGGRQVTRPRAGQAYQRCEDKWRHRSVARDDLRTIKARSISRRTRC